MPILAYRGKTLNDNVWVHGDLSHTSDGFYCINSGYADCGSPRPVQPATIGLCTGLTDKNGKLLFEGDIVKCTGGGGLLCFGMCECIGIIKHELGGGTRSTLCRFYVQTIGDPLNEANFIPATMEIIGNIYDNPDMLKEA